MVNKQTIAYEPIQSGAAASIKAKPTIKTKTFCSSIEVKNIPSSSTQNIFYQAQKPSHQKSNQNVGNNRESGSYK